MIFFVFVSVLTPPDTLRQRHYDLSKPRELMTGQHTVICQNMGVI